MQPVILIPSYKPDKNLLEIVQGVLQKGFTAVVVDDGSGPSFQSIFDTLRQMQNVHVLSHFTNLGKGAALKTGMNYAMLSFPGIPGLVTADADGQHKLEDIKRVADGLLAKPNDLVLGARKFKGEVPLRSAFGNKVTRTLFRFLIGPKLLDTQTGLRGIPAGVIPTLLQIQANRYEFEFDMLIRLHRQGVKIREVIIETVYVNDNAGSHFNPITDSLKIYFVFFRYIFSSLITALIDNIVFFISMAIVPHILLATAAARITSWVFQFTMSRNFVFHSRKKLSLAAVQYVTLGLTLGALSYGLITVLMEYAGLHLIVAKLSTETLLFCFSFSIQRALIFSEPDLEEVALTA